jgi:hypothetical protein
MNLKQYKMILSRGDYLILSVPGSDLRQRKQILMSGHDEQGGNIDFCPEKMAKQISLILDGSRIL